ncbi:MAG: hypothetical protein GTO45_11780 [Candidatus Aminicenantes bacterium]|nr:hypothetical protein [Candidatus Aminicenantes bacterium]NIM79485.1 hypothetical protein [Candidatus Aminicenantes bacterium]NIN18771.1 hypothetical protein [Candidatus Aminicenantes bacterium]NIN42693.1 hypothetical protein [Candidatus Aminicenantes bacterium]NIN85427.1 hypothetical protein [Candidatus Aminicenantes bacterium]
MKRSIFVLFLTVCIGIGAGLVSAAQAKVVDLPGLLRPLTVTADKSQIYITEEAAIYIYSLTNFRLIKKFGRKGEGPEEFKTIPNLPVVVNVRTNDLIVNSIGKVSYFTKEGTFKKEIKTPGGFNVVFIPIGEKFVGTGLLQENKTNYLTLNLYDANLKKINEIYRTLYQQQPGQTGIQVSEKSFDCDVYDNKIFISGAKEFVIDVLDSEGKPLYSIKQEYELIKFTGEMKNMVLNHLKTDPDTKPYFEMIKWRLKFPDTLPAIFNLFVSNQNVYAITNKTGENEKPGEKKREVYIFEVKGKFLKKVFLPIYESGIEPFPFCIENKKLYQLVERESDEVWELHITDIE